MIALRLLLDNNVYYMCTFLEHPHRLIHDPPFATHLVTFSRLDTENMVA